MKNISYILEIISIPSLAVVKLATVVTSGNLREYVLHFQRHDKAFLHPLYILLVALVVG